MEDDLSMIEISGGLMKAGIDYSEQSNTLLIQRGGVITFWNLGNDDKRIIRTFRQVHHVKLFKSGKYFLLVYILFDGIEIELYESGSLRRIKQRKIVIDTKNNSEVNIINIFLSFISKEELLIVIKGNDKQNWLFKVKIEKLTYDLREEYIGMFRSRVKNMVVFKGSNANTFITANGKAIYYWVYDSKSKEINVANKIIPKVELNYASLTISDSISSSNCIVGILTEKGECLIYDMSANCKDRLENEQDYYSHLSLEDGIIILGCSNGKIYVYDQTRMILKYIISTKEGLIEESYGLNPLSVFKVFLNEERNILIIIRLNGAFEYHNLSTVLENNKQYKTIPLIEGNNHNEKIIAIEWLNEPPLTFYTSSIDNHLIKWNYRGDKWISQSFPLKNNTIITCLKLHPQYNNFLYATDNQGMMLQIDLCSHDNNSTMKSSTLQSFPIANFSIESVTFNKGNLAAFGFKTGMILIYTLDFNSRCEFNIKILEDFLDEEKVSKRLKDQSLTSFVHFLNSTNDSSLIIRSGMNTIAVVGINRINNTMITTIDDELEYDANDEIIDIVIHPSEKYMLVLLESKQINIREIGSWRNIGVIDVMPKLVSVHSIAIDHTGTFLSVLGSNTKGTMKNSNIVLYDVTSGDVVSETGEMFTISKHIISTDGRFMIATGIDGTMTMIRLSKTIKERIYNEYDLMMVDSRKYWSRYDIEYPMQRRILKKVTDMIHNDTTTSIQNKQKTKKKETIQSTMKDNDTIKETYENNHTQMKTEDFNPQPHNNIINKEANTTRNKDMPISNYINVNTTQKCNTMDSFNTHRQLHNNTWNQQKQYSQLGLLNNNSVTLNKDPNLFPLHQSAGIQKVNQNYLNSQSLAYPSITRNLIETSSKNQQDEIRYNNITKAIQDILTQEGEGKASNQKGRGYINKDRQQSTTSNQETSMCIGNKPSQQKKNKTGMNKDYYINNQTKQTTQQNLPDPEGIDDLSIMIKKNQDNDQSSHYINNNNNTSINQISKGDISFISAYTNNNAKISIADDIDYIYDNIERFENQQQYNNNIGN